MKVLCDVVAERVVLDEPLGDLANHVKACSRCQRLVAMPARLGAAVDQSRQHHANDPGLGFAARMTVGARHRIAVRHRRRVAGGLAVAVAAGVVGVFVVTRSPDAGPTAERTATTETEPAIPDTRQRPVVAAPRDLQMLVNLSDTRRAQRVSAPWGRIERPLKPYKKLVKGVAQ